MRRIGLGALAVYLFLPEVAVFVLLGFATNWWVAGLIAGGTFAGMVLAVWASRSRGFLGRVLGTTDYDPLAYSQWTRYLVVRTLVVSLPAGLAMILAIAFTVDASLTTTVVAMIASGLAGFAVGGWLWVQMENRHRSAS